MAAKKTTRPRRPAAAAAAARARAVERRRVRRRWLLVGLAVASLAVLITVGTLALRGGTGGGKPEVARVAPRAAAQLINAHAGETNLVTLDIRTPAEFAGGHLNGATNIDYYAAGFRAELEKLDRNKSYVVYCHTGNRSGKATALMSELGFRHVYDVQGGIAAWQQAGLPVVS